MSDVRELGASLISGADGDFRIRVAQQGDATSLTAFAERVFRDTFASANDPVDLELFLANSYQPEIQAREIADPAVVTLLGELDGTQVAFAQLGGDHSPPAGVSGETPFHLWRFYVDPAQHGRGFARELMERCLAVARERAASTLWLTVWEKNPRAIAFYDKCGFDDVGTTTFTLGRESQTDRVMAYELG